MFERRGRRAFFAVAANMKADRFTSVQHAGEPVAFTFALPRRRHDDTPYRHGRAQPNESLSSDHRGAAPHRATAGRCELLSTSAKKRSDCTQRTCASTWKTCPRSVSSGGTVAEVRAARGHRSVPQCGLILAEVCAISVTPNEDSLAWAPRATSVWPKRAGHVDDRRGGE